MCYGIKHLYYKGHKEWTHSKNQETRFPHTRRKAHDCSDRVRDFFFDTLVSIYRFSFTIQRKDNLITRNFASIWWLEEISWACYEWGAVSGSFSYVLRSLSDAHLKIGCLIPVSIYVEFLYLAKMGHVCLHTMVRPVSLLAPLIVLFSRWFMFLTGLGEWYNARRGLESVIIAICLSMYASGFLKPCI